MIGETHISFIIDRHINKEDPLFELAKKGLKKVKEDFEKHTGFNLELKKYDILKHSNGKSRVIGVYEIYKKKREED